MTDTIKEEDVFNRPTSLEIQSRWKSIFSDPLISISRLKADALSRGGLGEVGMDGGVVLRSVYWRFYHSLLPPPTSLDLFLPALQARREGYDNLRRRYLIAPDGRWASDCSGYDEYLSSGGPSSSTTTPASASSSSSSSATKGVGASEGGEGWDPLSLSQSSPWKTWFSHLDLRSTIAQDVQRTFPDIRYFELPSVRRCLTTSLFVFAVLNPDVGYRQGMHELLACCFWVVDRDSLDNNSRGSPAKKTDLMDEAMRVTLDRRFVEHDAFELFAAIMKGGKAFYEWRAEEAPVRTRTPSAPQAPIIVRCNNLHTSLVRRIDPQLWERLEAEGVEAQIWAIRWLRLIFTRELPFHLALRLWDGVFAEDPGLQLLDFVCVAMLLLIRNELIEADYPTLLTNLLHYPAPSTTYPFEPFLILSQALFLRNNISPAAGVEIVLQNQDLLGIKASPPERERDETTRLRGSGRGRGMARGGMSVRGGMRGGKPGVGGLAQGLFERAQAAGLDKAFMSTVADLRKNLPDSATAYSYLPNLPFSPITSPSARDAAAPFSSIPNSISALPPRTFLTSPSDNSTPPRPGLQSRQSIDSQSSQKTVKDAEREMAELRLAMLGMGKAMTEWLTTLRSEGEDEDPDGEKEAAWKGLDKIRDTLLDAAGSEVDEIVREWGWHDGLEAPRSRATTPAPNPALASEPPPVPIAAPLDVQIEKKDSPIPAHKGTMDFEDVTPTPPSVAVLPSMPTLPVAPPITANPGPSQSALPPKPSVHLSSSRGSPATGLPRIPITAPLGSGFARYEPQEQTTRPSSAGWNSSSGYVNRDDRDGEVGNGDPLAGLGVSVRKPAGTASGKPNASSGVDPLLGVGVR
ncbi:hypothetical protein CI109_106851 [Kwoniella shandongensis]|uniref:Uncharacterized protein n=1 Tax=Kwoniella shandongensis TaxID=1734106 RepID=A0A5M6C6R0_9TREE|nr:uncharacterized protein CI109_000893 [Kwoniella shandongensis]KAA5530713.1 hypothetical protein CI109_000893 [Kwoniella shandongensis]